MKLTKDTLIEGKIIEKGTELSILKEMEIDFINKSIDRQGNLGVTYLSDDGTLVFNLTFSGGKLINTEIHRDDVKLGYTDFYKDEIKDIVKDVNKKGLI